MPEPPLRRHTEVLAGLLPLAGARVLDAGCGEGGLVAWLRRRGAAAFGLDPSGPALRAAAARLGGAEGGAAGPAAPGLVRGEAHRLPFAAGTLDAVVYLNSLHHLPTAAIPAALEAARHALRAGGRLVAIEPAAEGDHFELLRPVEDETAVRAAAAAALDAADPGRWATVERSAYALDVEVASAGELAARFAAADPARAPALARERGRLAALFDRLGAPLPGGGGGRAFRQPYRLVALERRDGPRLEVAEARRRDDRRAALAIRRAVFVEEQGAPLAAEFDAWDGPPAGPDRAGGRARHLLARLDGQPAGTLRWRPGDGDGGGGGGAVLVERVAVLRRHRGRGVGAALVRALLARLDAEGSPSTVPHAREATVGFFGRLGYAPSGEPFLEAGVPRRTMTRPRGGLVTAGPVG